MAKICINDNFQRLVLSEKKEHGSTVGSYTNQVTSSDNNTITASRENYFILDSLVSINGTVDFTSGMTGDTYVHLKLPIPKPGISGTLTEGPVTITDNIIEKVSASFSSSNSIALDIKTVDNISGRQQVSYYLSYFA